MKNTDINHLKLRLINLRLYSVMFLLLSINLNSQINIKEVDSLVNVSMKSIDNTVGLSIGIVKDNKIVFLKGYGLKSIKSKDSITVNTPFSIASNSKAFTTAALSILVDQGKLNWEDKVIDYIPELTMYNDYVRNNINIEDLLTHRTGLSLGAGDLMLFPSNSNFDIQDILNSFQYFKPVNPFRTKFEYNNLMYLVAGELIKRVSGKSWENFVESEILVPLKMNKTFTEINNLAKYEIVAKPHYFDGQNLQEIAYENISLNVNNDDKSLNGAASGIWASANDMCIWMLMQLNHGKYGNTNENSLYSLDQHRKMWSQLIPIHVESDPRSPFKTHFSGYGLGWFLSDFNGYLKVEHSGLVAGMSSSVTLIPEINLGIVILNNSDKSSIVNGMLNYYLLDKYLKINSGINWLQMAKSLQQQQELGDSSTEKIWEEIDSIKNSNINLKDYIGVYNDNWFGKAEVYESNGNLFFKSHKSPRLNGKLHYYKENTFAIKWEYQDMMANALANFYMDSKGNILGIKMKPISRLVDFSFDFQDLDLVKE